MQLGACSSDRACKTYLSAGGKRTDRPFVGPKAKASAPVAASAYILAAQTRKRMVRIGAPLYLPTRSNERTYASHELERDVHRDALFNFVLGQHLHFG
jgi:hypothetical protein